VFVCELVSPIRRGLCHMLGKAYVGDTVVMEGELLAQIVKNNNDK
jgi:UDP-3-O-[3-hydroxymyristoyl] N-acetylglucosamine deacetylase/3-hydroxyacyl-[acyl-carrier-protein] dehydratase